jgi:hypothetical protein
MHIKKIFLFITTAAVIAISACKKDSSTINNNNNTTGKKDTTSTPTKKTGTYVYVAGIVKSSQSVPVATYWANGVAHALADSSSESYAYAIATADTNVYIAGIANNAATYWKNGVATTLANGSMALGITISGSDVYVAGVSNLNGTNVATYWKNGVATTLTDIFTTSVAVSIVVSGGDVYVAGYLVATGGMTTVCYWKNGIIQNQLTTSVSTFGPSYDGVVGVGIVGSDVYITGTVENTGGDHVNATLWKNGTPNVVVTDGDHISSALNAITISGSKVYLAGYDDNVATYWINGTAYQLNSNAQQYMATGIAVSSDVYAVGGNDVYVSGFSGYSITNAVYWKNGNLVTLSTRNSTTCGIGIVKY